MSTGPWHYAEAERLLGLAGQQWLDGQDSDPYPLAALTVARAQAHATLALTAATAEAARHADGHHLVVYPSEAVGPLPSYPGTPWGTVLKP